MDVRRTLQVLTVVLAAGATAYLWASPVMTEFPSGQLVRGTIWADPGDWLPIVATSLTFLVVICLGTWAAAQLRRTASTAWKVTLVTAAVAAVAGVVITGFSVGPLYVPSVLFLVMLTLHSLALPTGSTTASH